MSDERLADLLAAALDALDAGGDDALDRFIVAHGEDATWLRERLAALREFGVLHAAPESNAPPTQLGEFILKERLGSGGMGIVYRAEQPSLQREVALKVIRPEHLFFAGARERFRREVESIAKLQHPSIVRVYAAGDAAGVPYFTMERIDGVSLETLLAALRASKHAERGAPTDDRTIALVLAELRAARGSHAPLLKPQHRSWVETCFRWVKELAEALAYAHELGVLHRDVKPANVMITWSGKAMLLDFGLATTRGATRITRSGSMVGSVPYMAPEQLRGERAGIDERTDVYSLGVTLFELLALRHPFHEAQEEVEETRRRILDGSPPSLRRVAAAVPWDAETVCLTAMERDSARRYPSAAAFAADLGNVLEFRPIAARRPGPALRLRRFAQRHPAASVGAVLGFVLLAGGPLGLWWAQVARTRAVTREQSKTSEALVVVTRQRDEIEEQRELAEARFDTALDSVVDLLTKVGYTQLNNVPNAGAVRRELLQLAERTAQKLLQELPDHPRARYVAGWVDELLARVLMDRGLREDARRHLIRSAATLSAAEEGAKDPQPRLVHAMSENLLAITYQEEERWSEAAEHFDAAIELHRSALDVLTDVGWSDKHKRQLANTLCTFGVVQAKHLGHVDEGIDSLTEACEILEEVGTTPEDSMRLAMALNNLGTVHDDLRRFDEAEAVFARAVATARAVVTADPRNYESRKCLPWIITNLAGAQGKLGKFDESVPALIESVALLRALAADYPERVEVGDRLASTLGALAAHHCDCKEYGLAEPVVREAIALRDAQIAATGETPEMHADRAISRETLSTVLKETGRGVEADALLETALQELAAAAAKFPGARARFEVVRGYLEGAK